MNQPSSRRSLYVLLSVCAALACGKDSDTTTTGDAASSGASTGPATATAAPTTGGPEPSTGEPATTTTAGTSGASTSTSTTGEPASTGEPATGSSTGPIGVPMPVECGGMIYECGDAMDNDGDGNIDGGDLECTSPCDDSEGSFQTNLPGQNMDCLADCYWDGDSGQGNDHCVWSLKCDPENPGADINCAYDPNQKDCDTMQPALCLEVCAAITPNGCDCFGCCNVDTPDGTLQIYLGGDPDCSLKNLAACGSCTFQPGCNNTCDPEACELCFGQTELPPGCEEAGCDNMTPCKVDKFGNSDCAEGFFCSTGCCQPIEPG
ncbi:MAG: hypothetical protein JNK56_14925 [Myxococcales bacterium]|nr:hypothetical protein [Myxococcales bacterium]